MGYFVRDLGNPRQTKAATRSQELKALADNLIDAWKSAEENKKVNELKALEFMAKDSKNYTKAGDFEIALNLLDERKNDTKNILELTSLQADERLIENNQNTFNYKTAANASLDSILSQIDATGSVKNPSSTDVNAIIGSLQKLKDDVSTNQYLSNEKSFIDEIGAQIDLIDIMHMVDTHDVNPDKIGFQSDNPLLKMSHDLLIKGDIKGSKKQKDKGLLLEEFDVWANQGVILQNDTKRWVGVSNKINSYVESKATKIKGEDAALWRRYADTGIFEYTDFVEEFKGKFTGKDIPNAISKFGGPLDAAMNNPDINWEGKGGPLLTAYNKGKKPALIEAITKGIRADNNLSEDDPIYDQLIIKYIKDLGVKWIPKQGFKEKYLEGLPFIHIPEAYKEMNDLGAELFASMYITNEGLYEFSEEMYGKGREYKEDPSSFRPYSEEYMFGDSTNINSGNIFPE